MLAGVLERLLKSYLSRWLSVTASHLQVLNVGVWSGDLHFQQLHMLHRWVGVAWISRSCALRRRAMSIRRRRTR